jgi:Flp pilus assembly protein TadG
VAAVELALVCPFLAFLLVVAVDFSRVFFYQAVLNNCARNGAMYASQLGSYGETDLVDLNNQPRHATIQDGSTLSPPLTTSNVQIDNGKGSDGNDNVTVTITYTFTTITQFPGIASSWTLTATCSMRSAS